MVLGTNPASVATRRTVVLAAIVLLAVACGFALASEAFAYEEPNSQGGVGGCTYCHPMPLVYPDMACEDCHGDEEAGGAVGYEPDNFQGPHGGYTTGTSKCENCHQIHNAASGGKALLPEPTIVATCFTCHDGTGGWGVYGTIEARTGSAPGGGHSYEETSVVPGGDGATGGATTRVFKGPDGTLICTDCHSPHGSNTVAAFKGDRRRLRTQTPSITSTRLLRQMPTTDTAAVTEYGSDWCAACHEGRTSSGMVMNHPVDSSAETSSPFTYGNVAVLASESATGVTIMSTLGGLPNTGLAHDWPADVDPSGNRGFLMPYPRTTQQSGHAPICQQCHEDSRSVGTLVGDGSSADASPAVVAAADGVAWSSGWTSSTTDNPYVQNFPHETQNNLMLVEEYDDLCLNCHPLGQLP